MLPSVFQRLLSAHGGKLISLGLTGSGAAYIYYQDHNPLEPSVRFLRTASCAVSIAIDYQLSKCDDDDNECLAAVHTRSAKKLVTLCLRNGGIYVKAGQYMASLTHVFPIEYTKTLSTLQDQAAPRNYSEVIKVFTQELKCHPDEIFSTIDTCPLAAASLAQVHRAILRDSGIEVAVKVQYPRLHALFLSDLVSLTNICKCLGRIYPNLDLMWMVEEFRGNLMKELDFRLEGKSAERISQYLSLRNDVAVPKIYWKYTTGKILVMDFIEGVKVTNIKALNSLGFDPKEVGAIVCDVFAEMIFQYGFIHADPHAGNILVRRRPGNFSKPQIVLLDHGLYQELSDGFRLDYCELWLACLWLDRDKLKDICSRLNVEQYYKFFPIMFTFRSLPSKGGTCRRLGDPVTKADIVNEIKGLGAEFQVDGLSESLNRFLSNLPRPMLLILKTQNLVRQINKELHGSTLLRMQSMFCWAVRGSYSSQHHSLWRKIIDACIVEYQLVRLRLNLWLLNIGLWFRDSSWRQNRAHGQIMIG